MAVYGGDDVLIGSGVDDKAEAEAAPKATLQAMGIETLSPYGSPVMTTAERPVYSPAEIRAKARWPNPTPRQIARAAGETYYRGSKPCRHGHDSLRSVASGGCLACTDIWESENKERVRAHWRESKQRMRDRARLVENCS